MIFIHKLTFTTTHILPIDESSSNEVTDISTESKAEPDEAKVIGVEDTKEPEEAQSPAVNSEMEPEAVEQDQDKSPEQEAVDEINAVVEDAENEMKKAVQQLIYLLLALFNSLLNH